MVKRAPAALQTCITGDIATAMPAHCFPGNRPGAKLKKVCNLHMIARGVHLNSAKYQKVRRIKSVENPAPTRSITLGIVWGETTLWITNTFTHRLPPAFTPIQRPLSHNLLIDARL
jgi:hypothetical protein